MMLPRPLGSNPRSVASLTRWPRIDTCSRSFSSAVYQPKTIWQRESLGLWIIEADGVTRRLQSDGRGRAASFGSLVENGINIHAEVIPRSRFKQYG